MLEAGLEASNASTIPILKLRVRGRSLLMIEHFPPPPSSLVIIQTLNSAFETIFEAQERLSAEPGYLASGRINSLRNVFKANIITTYTQ